MPDQAIRRLERDLALFFGGVLLITAAGILTVVFWQTNRLRDDARHACRVQNTARQDSNAHLRRPLKTIAEKAAGVLYRAAAQQRGMGHVQAATETVKVAAAFSEAAASVNYLRPLNCAALNGG